MATVYLAHDLKHDRDVALKVLKPELGAVLGVKRFLTEIKVTANLQHPNLLPLFDSGSADGLLFYVMPFVEGESLRARLDRETVLSVDEAIHIASAMAGALDYAHRQNVIRRDLKPENVLLHEGQPLIADFGIALAVSNAGGARITQTGLSLGTPQYMSPEQAMGEREVDRRSDIYSFAALVYEMLAGEPPHTGATAQAIIARVMTERPRSIRESRDTVPEYVDLAIQRGLSKLPADRWATAREFGAALTDPNAMSGSRAVFGVASRASARAIARRLRRALPWALAIAGAATAGVSLWKSSRGDVSSAVVRVPLNLGPGVEVITARGSPFSLSPDGTVLAFAATMNGGVGKLFIRPLDELEAREVPGTEEAQQPFFSPDGKWIGYYARQQLRKVPVAGGASVPIGDIPVQIHGASWGSRGDIVFATDGVLSVVATAGGKPRAIASPDSSAGETFQRFPHFLADGKTILYESWRKEGLASAKIGVVSSDGTHKRILDLTGSDPLEVVHGYLVYAAPVNTIMAVPFDERRGIVTGLPTVVVDGAVVGAAGAIKGTVSKNGTLVYSSSRQSSQLVLTDGRSQPRVLLADPRYYANPRFSPNGRQVALTVLTSTGSDIYLLDLSSGALRRFTTEGRSNDYADWSPDGKRVLFGSNRGGQTAVWWQAADGSQPAERLFGSPTAEAYDGVVAPDGRTLVARAAGDVLWYRNIAGDTTARLLTAASADPQYSQRFSPDGHWLAFSSNHAGTRQVFVVPFPGPGQQVQVSRDGGADPMWSRDGRQLFYVHAAQLIAASVTPGPRFAVTGHSPAFERGWFENGSGFHANYDVSPDGKQFLMLKPVGGNSGVIVVHNWQRELRARMAANVGK